MTRKILQMTCACFALAFAAATFATAQESTDKSSAAGASSNTTQQETATGPAVSRTSADETFELNIAERRITRRNFEASTSVEAGEESARGLRLRVGVAIGAGSIDVLLRNVRGQVRFRATLERVLERINARRTEPSP
jgi:ribosomal protein L27